MRRVVITGLGPVTPIGIGREPFWSACQAGRTGFRVCEHLVQAGCSVTIAAPVQGFSTDGFLEPKEARNVDPFCRFALVAAKLAVADAGLGPPSPQEAPRRGVIIGTGIGGLQEIEDGHATLTERGPRRVSPHFIPKLMSNAATGQVAIHLGWQGPNFSTASACASANHAMGMAFWILRMGLADVILTGGAEATITPLAISGFANMKALSTNPDPQQACRPFDKDRDGFVMGEGAGVLVFEEYERARARGATIYAEVLGFGMTDDAYHITAPAQDGGGAVRAMRLAFQDAGREPRELSYVNAHGTSTPYNDAMETKAIKALVGEERARQIPVSSTKSQIGHLLGASGGAELIATALAVRDDRLPPTMGYRTPDPACDLDYVSGASRAQRVDLALSNSLGFGGHNASILIGKVAGA